MGNCLVLEDKVVQVVRPDGKILEYKAPIQVHEALKEFPGHELSDSLTKPRQLWPGEKLFSRRLYYLVPLPPPSPPTKKKKVRFANPEVEDGQGTNVVRIKVVVSKQELKMLLRGGSVEDMISRSFDNRSCKAINGSDFTGECKAWKPELEDIPEMD